MTSDKGPFKPSGLTISYKELGTVSIDEWIHAFLEDMQALKRDFNVSYVKVSRINMCVTNEYGEEIKVRRPGGGSIHFMHTNHYRPACMDYEL
jgi:hypothetical protein